MTRDFLFESDHFLTPDQQFCAQMRVIIAVFHDACTTPKGIQKLQEMKIRKIYDEDNRIERKLEDFPEDEQNKILKKAEELADVYLWEKYESERYPYGA